MSSPKSCADPVPLETLTALWSGELPPDDAERVEAHLFSCDACSATSDRLGMLVEGIRDLIPPVISHAHRDRLLSQGMKILETKVEASTPARAYFASELDLLVHVLHADLSRAERVDVAIVSQDGVPRVSFEHVPFDRQAGEVLISCQRHYQGMFPGDPFFRVSVVEGGARRTVGDFLVIHEWP